MNYTKPHFKFNNTNSERKDNVCFLIRKYLDTYDLCLCLTFVDILGSLSSKFSPAFVDYVYHHVFIAMLLNLKHINFSEFTLIITRFQRKTISKFNFELYVHKVHFDSP